MASAHRKSDPWLSCANGPALHPAPALALAAWPGLDSLFAAGRLHGGSSRAILLLQACALLVQQDDALRGRCKAPFAFPVSNWRCVEMIQLKKQWGKPEQKKTASPFLFTYISNCLSIIPITPSTVRIRKLWPAWKTYCQLASAFPPTAAACRAVWLILSKACICSPTGSGLKDKRKLICQMACTSA